MLGGSDPEVLSSSQSQGSSKVFGPGVIGSDPTLGEDLGYPSGSAGGFRGPADDLGQQSGVSQVTPHASILEGAHDVHEAVISIHQANSFYAFICVPCDPCVQCMFDKQSQAKCSSI